MCSQQGDITVSRHNVKTFPMTRYIEKLVENDFLPKQVQITQQGLPDRAG